MTPVPAAAARNTRSVAAPEVCGADTPVRESSATKVAPAHSPAVGRPGTNMIPCHPGRGAGWRGASALRMTGLVSNATRDLSVGSSCNLALPMRTALVVAAVFFGCAFAQDAQKSGPPAQSFAPATSQTFYLDLDTAEGSFSQWRHDDLGSLSALRANIRVPRIRKDHKWAPAFSVFLQNTEAGKVQNQVGLQLLNPDRKSRLEIRVVQFTGKQLTTTETSGRTLGLDEDLIVEMVWSTPHTITIKIGDSETHSVSIPWAIDRVAVFASTGQMKVDPLMLGSAGK